MTDSASIPDATSAVDYDSAVDGIIDLRSEPAKVVEATREVRFVDLAADYEEHREELRSAIDGVLRRCDFILGEATEVFENEFAEYCGVDHAVGVDSGFSAIELILRAFDIGPGDEVIVPANTFYSTVRPIETVGATPVVVDAHPVQRNIDAGAIEAAITPATRAIMPVHLYGQPAEMDLISKVANEHGIYVFEDACQGHGSYYRGKRAGSLGDAAAFSFYPSKNLGAFGDAGIAVTQHDEANERMRRMRNLGSASKYQHEGDGFNRRLDTMHAAVLRVKLAHLDAANQKRHQVAAWYSEALANLDIILPSPPSWADPVYHLYVIETTDRTGLASDLNRRGIQTGIHYPTPIHLIPAFASLGYAEGDFPVAEQLANRILSLPMHPYVTPEDVDHIADAIGWSLHRAR